MRLEQWIYRLPLIFRSLFRRSEVEHELDEELQYHIEMATDEHIRGGMSPEEARRAAVRQMHGLEQSKEECRDARGIRWLDDFVQDLSYARRSLMRCRTFSLVTILILALGIGANSAIFSTLYAMLFQPMPFGNIDRLVDISGSNYLNYLDLREETHSFTGVAAFMGLPLEAQDANSVPLTGRAVSANFFEVLDLSLPLGRGFLPYEEKITEGQAVVVISYRFWERNYGRDPGVLGKTIVLNKEVLAIVGVAPQKLRDAVFGGPYCDFYVPIPMFARIAGLADTQMWRDAIGNRAMYPFLNLIGRLGPDVTPGQARAQLAGFASRLHKTYPKDTAEWKPALNPADRARWPGKSALFFPGVLIAAALCIFFTTCTNVAGLVLARGSARSQEIGTRLALGAGRPRIVRQLLTEGFTLSALATLVSLVVYVLTLRLLPAFETSIGSQISLDLIIDHRALIFAVGIGLLSNLTFGLAPALILSRTNLSEGLKDQRFPGFRPSRSRSRRILVVSQIALTVIVLIAAGLLIRTIRHFESTTPGFDTNVLVISQSKMKFEPDDAGKKAFYSEVLERVQRLPGVNSASWGEQLPFGWSINPRKVRPDRMDYAPDKWASVECNAVSPEYLKTLGIPILQGRDFSDRGMSNSAGSVIVNETLARRFWNDANPLGKHILVRDTERWSYGKPGPESYEVIGVAKDAKYLTPWEDKMPYLYIPYWNMLYYHMDLHVSARGNPQSLIEPIRRIFEEVDPDTRMSNARLISTQLDSVLYQERSAALVLGIFGVFALALAVTGLYGIVSYSVAQRAREFGIRIALGANKASILKHVVSEGVHLALAGLGIGLPVSIAASRLLASRLHGLSPLSPLVYIVISLVVIAAAGLAALLPARRAAANPMNALRTE
jgi:predicted permease